MAENTALEPTPQVETQLENQQAESFRILRPLEVAKKKGVLASTKLLYAVLYAIHYEHKRKTGSDTFVVSHSRLAERIGMSVATVKLRLRELRELGLIFSYRTGRCSVYKLLEKRVDNSDCKKGAIANRIPQDIRGRGVGEDSDTNLGSYAGENHFSPSVEEEYGKEQLRTDEGKILLRRIDLLGYDLFPEKIPLEVAGPHDTKKRRNIARKNWRLLAHFVFNNDLDTLEFCLEKSERTSLDNGAGTFRRMIKPGGLFPDEERRIEQRKNDYSEAAG